MEKIDGVPDTPLAATCRAAALAAGRRSLAFEVTDPRHPAFGVSTVRWEPSRAVPAGWVEYLSASDSLFLAGWGWMSVYRNTGDSVNLARTQTLAAAAERRMREYPVVPQDWVVERARWTPHTLVESVFGVTGFRRVVEAPGDPRIAGTGRRYIESHLRHMGRERGRLARAWIREGGPQQGSAAGLSRNITASCSSSAMVFFSLSASLAEGFAASCSTLRR